MKRDLSIPCIIPLAWQGTDGARTRGDSREGGQVAGGKKQVGYHWVPDGTMELRAWGWGTTGSRAPPPSLVSDKDS